MTITGDYRFAGFWIRVLAYIIDAIVIWIVVGIVTYLALGRSAMTGGAPSSGSSALGLILLVFEWLYFAGLESSAWRGTLGKKACGLIVADLEGDRISFLRATGRFFAKIISAIILLIGFMMVGWTHRKQGLHDKIAGTLVLRRAAQVFTPTVHEVGHIGGMRVTTQVGGIDTDQRM
ncbi:MAG TPA: RDD family protein [Stellaceae bacterium]